MVWILVRYKNATYFQKDGAGPVESHWLSHRVDRVGLLEYQSKTVHGLLGTPIQRSIFRVAQPTRPEPVRTRSFFSDCCCRLWTILGRASHPGEFFVRQIAGDTVESDEFEKKKCGKQQSTASASLHLQALHSPALPPQ